ncbi:CAP domain-containing protein [Thiocystis violacea]|uniref:CAP domain-containing protein n=1 Tax=Thiocystis violacea TaxID=13725 RepID=UPI001907A83E|nr:CAP domain-containing protein [Thiocystis violacea]MBK1722461.1 hypothetical protein [Thiocystis violacea]
MPRTWIPRTSLLPCLILACASCAPTPDRHILPTADPVVEPHAQEDAPADTTAAREIIDRNNTLRHENGLRPVVVDQSLQRAALDFAAFMASSGRYGHEADGGNPAARANRHGYDHCILAENIAYLFSAKGLGTEAVVETAFQGWCDSPGHRKNMLDPDVTQTGVAVARNRRGDAVYAVQLFGRPRSERRRFQVRNGSDTTIHYRLGAERYPLGPGVTRTHHVCRSEPLSLTEQGHQSDVALTPGDGDRLAIFRLASGSIQLKTER